MTQCLTGQAIFPKIRMLSEFDTYIKAEMDRMAPGGEGHGRARELDIASFQPYLTGNRLNAT